MHTFIHLILAVLRSCVYLPILYLDVHPCFVERATKHNDRSDRSIQLPMRTVNALKSAGALSILLHLDHFVHCKQMNHEWSAQVHRRQEFAGCLCCLNLPCTLFALYQSASAGMKKWGISSSSACAVWAACTCQRGRFALFEFCAFVKCERCASVAFECCGTEAFGCVHIQ